MDIQTINAELLRIRKEKISFLQDPEHHKKDIDRLLAEESELIDLLNRQYIADLPDASTVLQDARQLLPEALEFIYFQLSGQLESTISGTDPALIGLKHFTFNRFDTDYPDIVARQRSAAFTPETALFFLEESSIREYAAGHLLALHFERLKGKPEAKELKAFISETVRSCRYVQKATGEKEPIDLLKAENMPIYHRNELDELAIVKLEKSYTSTARYESEDGRFKLRLKDIDKLTGTLNVRTHALFSVAGAFFTRETTLKKGSKPQFDTTVTIPVNDYLQRIGYDIIEHEKKTEAEQRAEKKRVKIIKKKARQQLKEDLKVLANTTIEIRRKNGFAIFSLLQYAELKGDYIYCTFSNDIQKFFAEQPTLTQFPGWLLEIVRINPTGYQIGYKLSNHFSMNAGKESSNTNRLTVKALLSDLGLTSYKELQKKNYSGRPGAFVWKAMIQQPFENALDFLLRYENGGLCEWHYETGYRSGNRSVSREEAHNMQYFDWEKLVIVFTLVNPPAVERIARIKQDPAGKGKKLPRRKKTKSA